MQNPTDAEILAAIDAGVANGTLIRITSADDLAALLGIDIPTA